MPSLYIKEKLYVNYSIQRLIMLKNVNPLYVFSQCWYNTLIKKKNIIMKQKLVSLLESIRKTISCIFHIVKIIEFVNRYILS